MSEKKIKVRNTFLLIATVFSILALLNAIRYVVVIFTITFGLHEKLIYLLYTVPNLCNLLLIGLYLLMIYLKAKGVIKNNAVIKAVSIIGIIFAVINILLFLIIIAKYKTVSISDISGILYYIGCIGIFVFTDKTFFDNNISLKKIVLYTIIVILSTQWDTMILQLSQTTFVSAIKILAHDLVPSVALLIAVWINKMPAKAAVDDNNTDSTDLIN